MQLSIEELHYLQQMNRPQEKDEYAFQFKSFAELADFVANHLSLMPTEKNGKEQIYTASLCLGEDEKTLCSVNIKDTDYSDKADKFFDRVINHTDFYDFLRNHISLQKEETALGINNIKVSAHFHHKEVGICKEICSKEFSKE